jgi:hypothetical protein
MPRGERLADGFEEGIEGRFGFGRWLSGVRMAGVDDLDRSPRQFSFGFSALG